MNSMKKTEICSRRLITVLLVIIVLATIATYLLYRCKTYNLLIDKPKQEKYVDCTDDLQGLIDYYNVNGVGQMQIQGARMYDNGSRDAMIYIDGVCNIPEANSSILLIRDYLQNNEEQFFDNEFYIHICFLGVGEDTTENLASMIEINFEISDPVVETVYLQEGSIINSEYNECVPLDVDIVNINVPIKLTSEEYTVLEQNYPNANYALP